MSLLYSCSTAQKEVFRGFGKQKPARFTHAKALPEREQRFTPREMKPGCGECFPREPKFPFQPFLKWPSHPKSFALYFSFHTLFALPAVLAAKFNPAETFFLPNSSERNLLTRGTMYPDSTFTWCLIQPMAPTLTPVRTQFTHELDPTLLLQELGALECEKNNI